MGYNSKGQLAICSGNGDCFCDSCSCNQGYTGYSCGCPPPSYNVSSRERSNATARIGTYCEECKTCTGACSNILSCVECHITGTCGTRCANITYVQNRTSVPGYDGTMGMKVVTHIPLITSLASVPYLLITSQSCEVIYELDRYVTGLEGNVYVVLDTTQKNYATLRAMEFLEYKQWEKSLREETNRSGSNPLFVDPTSSYSNPRYNARS
eukprot:Em0011g172a